jgi:Na+/H+ antiporter NhaC
MFDSFEWSFITVLAPIVLAGAIAYALLTRRRMSRAEQEVRNRETHKQYRDETDGKV